MGAAEGAFGQIIVMGVGIAIGVKIITMITDKAIEKKGLIGLLAVCYATSFYLLANTRSVADFMFVSRTDVTFVATLFFVIPTVIVLVYNREQVKRSAQTGVGIGKKAKTSTSKIKSKIGK